MKSKKMMIFVITIFTLIFSALLVNTSEATTFPDLAHEGYDTVKNYTLQDLHGSWSDGERQNCAQAMCIEKTAGDTTGALYVYATIDINADGESPTSATVTFRTANNNGTLSTASFTYSDDMLAEIAYICAMSDIEHDNYNHNHDISWQYKKMFLYYWEQKGFRDDLNNSHASIALPESADKGFLSSSGTGKRVHDDAVAYANAVATGTNDKAYSARIVVFKGGWMQTTAVLTGKESAVEKTTINKHITSVYSIDGETDSYSRANYTDYEKRSNAVMVAPGSIVTYSIEVTTNKSSVTVTDTFSEGLEIYNRGDFSGSGRTYTATAYKGTTILTIQLKVSESMPSGGTVYTNTATTDGMSSSDYVSCAFTEEEDEPILDNAAGNYKKYITHINGVAVGTNRSGYDNSTAKANPVTVKKGDTVTFKFEIENTSSVRIDNLTIRDSMESGLSYNGRSSFTYNFGTLDPGDSDTVSVTVDVTKSNMYLQPVENSVAIHSGTYEQRHSKTHRIVWYSVSANGTLRRHVYTWTEVWYTTEPINTSWFSSNANKDYIQLDDPEIAGDVWIDKDKDGLKESGETLLSGIPVKLYQNGTLYATRTTNSNGHYSFGKVPKGNKPYSGGTRKYADGSGYNSYYVVFEYNGVKYEDTVFTGATGVTDTGTTNNWNSKSHAQDVDRNGFNNSLETIAYNKAYAGKNGTEASKVLEYTKSGHTSTLNWTAATTIQAKSIDLFVNVSGGDTIKAEHIEYLKHINLGLVEKEQGDLSLKKDVISAVVTVNGYTSTYDYAKLGTGSYTGEYKLATPYKLKLYKGDYDFRTSDYPTGVKSTSDELDITLTYRVTLKNESSKYTSVVREVIDISTNSLTLQSTTMGTASTTSSYNSGTSYSYSGYQVHYIKMEASLAPNASTTFDLVYKVNKSNGAIILGEKANIAQIGAYSIYLNGTPAGVVDKDSNPGIINPTVIPTITDPSKYEDHCYYTSIILEDIPTSGDDKFQRKITGNVWEDLNTKTVSQTGQKIGDGKKNSGEQGAENITVVLLEKVNHNGTEYLIETGLSTETDASGNYTLKSSSGSDRIHAGEYVVRFIYGDEASEFVTTTGDTIRYSGQDYKSTVYTAPGTATNEAEVVDATAFATLKTSKGAQVSVARDDEIRRLEVVDYSTQMAYKLDNILKSHGDVGNKAELAKNTSMFADTKVFNVQIEKTNNTGVSVLTTVSENVDGTKTYTYAIGEVNFGLIERPVTKLELMDDIKEITAVTASGEEILHIYFDIAYKYNSTTKRVERDISLNEVLSTGEENVQMLDRTSSTKGFRYVNIDSELLQGMKITIKYQFAIANIGDIDTSNQNLIDMVKNYNVDEIVNTLNTTTVDARYKLKDVNSGINPDLLKNTTFTNVKIAVNQVKSSYGQYKTVVGASVNNKDYELGYFLGDTYYGTYNASTDKIVETRVDQIVSYVDNDLLFAPEDNVTSAGSPKFQTYTGAEIEAYGLLKDVTATNVSTKLVDGQGVSYITDTKNNLAFNVEDASINGTLYKYLTPLKNETTVNEDKLYMIELNASRVLASELDVENVVLDNLTEIVKISNTVGRKAYIEFIDVQTGKLVEPKETGYLGNTPDFIEDPDSRTVGQKEIDTNFTETVTFSPPTGLSQAEQKARTISTTLLVVLVGIVILAAGGGVAYMIGRKKIYK